MKHIGKVKWYSSTKGYGLIVLKDGPKDVFIYKSAVEEAGLNDLKDNQEVEFKVVEEKGRK